jgi:peptidoglycan/LPS O-acetylase OafA/YrhL
MVWKDVAISSLIVLAAYVLISLLFTQKPIIQCTGNCTPEQMNLAASEAGITNCSCWLSGYTQPFPYYTTVRLLLSILAGLCYYNVKNKPRPLELLIATVGMIILFAAYYVLLPSVVRMLGLVKDI